jgi:predicted nucleotidyltransferase component of viral defense system
MNYFSLNTEQKRAIIEELHDKRGLLQVVIEKDEWVTVVLRALFALPYAEHLSFKGGTSLSKCWKVIERFSEDVDIAINREFLGFTGMLSKTQISDKLRRSACSFVRERLQFDLTNQLKINGINPKDFSAKVNITPISTTDPEKIFIEYKSLFSDNLYIKPMVVLEISGRSMSEPVENVPIQSLLDEAFPDIPFVEKRFFVQAVVPQRTFLEKIMLLHEEFAKPTELLRTERMSRHLYDIVRMLDTPIAEKALNDINLYKSIVAHRRIFIGLKNFDYDTLLPDKINIIPPDNVISQWENDYKIMQKSMIYGVSLPFNKMIDKLKELNKRINNIEF